MPTAPIVIACACRHNRTIPDTAIDSNVVAWRKIEIAKHNLFYTLLKLKLPLDGRDDQDEAKRERLVFEFLASAATPNGQRVMTGHDNGVITVALEEADDAERENGGPRCTSPIARCSVTSATRSAHYYWDVWCVTAASWTAFARSSATSGRITGKRCRTTTPNGAPANWQDNFVSAYATAHPWEDFAETWAHYLHIVDTLEMARAFGIYVIRRWPRKANWRPRSTSSPIARPTCRPLVDTWIPLSNALNALNRTMGQPDIYPFILSPAGGQEAGRHPRSRSRR